MSQGRTPDPPDEPFLPAQELRDPLLHSPAGILLSEASTLPDPAAAPHAVATVEPPVDDSDSAVLLASSLADIRAAAAANAVLPVLPDVML